MQATSADVRRWRLEGREDILLYVGVVVEHSRYGVYDIWMKNDVEISCPFLKKGCCMIYATRPAVCCGYPWRRKCLKEEGQ